MSAFTSTIPTDALLVKAGLDGSVDCKNKFLQSLVKNLQVS